MVPSRSLLSARGPDPAVERHTTAEVIEFQTGSGSQKVLRLLVNNDF